MSSSWAASVFDQALAVKRSVLPTGHGFHVAFIWAAVFAGLFTLHTQRSPTLPLNHTHHKVQGTLNPCHPVRIGHRVLLCGFVCFLVSDLTVMEYSH